MLTENTVLNGPRLAVARERIPCMTRKKKTESSAPQGIKLIQRRVKLLQQQVKHRPKGIKILQRRVELLQQQVKLLHQ